MLFRTLADLVVLAHLAFVLFAVLGGILVRWRRRSAWVHLPVLLWAALVELAGWMCPLTPLENWLRVRGGGDAYRSGFIEHYLLPVLYPGELTRAHQIALGIVLLGVNLAIYAWALRRRASARI